MYGTLQCSAVRYGTYSTVLDHSTGHQLCNTVQPVQYIHTRSVQSYSTVPTVSYIYIVLYSIASYTYGTGVSVKCSRVEHSAVPSDCAVQYVAVRMQMYNIVQYSLARHILQHPILQYTAQCDQCGVIIIHYSSDQYHSQYCNTVLCIKACWTHVCRCLHIYTHIIPCIRRWLSLSGAPLR